MQKYLRHCTVFWNKWPVHDLVLVIPPPPLIKVASNTRPYSKLGGTTLNGREKGGQYYILQTCEQERFEARKVVFPWVGPNIFATGCSLAHIIKSGLITITLQRKPKVQRKHIGRSRIHDKVCWFVND